MDFPKRSELKNSIQNNNNTDYQVGLVDKLNEFLTSSDPTKWVDEPDVKINQVLEQKEFFWVRLYLNEEDSKLETGDIITMTHTPTNEKIEMIFGAYEKEGLNRDNGDSVIGYVSDDDKKVLCCMVDVTRVNKNSEDIPTLRTFFRNSRYFSENLFLKTDITIESENDKYEYSSISF